MKCKKSIPGWDGFRVLCAILIAALAVSPFTAEAAPPAALGEYLPFRQFVASFRLELARLYEADETVAYEDLREQAAEYKTAQLPVLTEGNSELSFADLYETCRDSVVLVGTLYKCGNCEEWHLITATGFAAGADGQIVTSQHVFKGEGKGETVGVMTRDGEVYPVRAIIAADSESDLAVLDTGAVGLRPLPLAGDVRVGEDVAVIHHPVHHAYAFTRGSVVGKFLHAHHGKSEYQLSISADFAKGSSGGPVLTSRGGVAGVVCTTLPVYYEVDHGVKKGLQMVWKNCAPSASLMRLLQGAEEDVQKPQERTDLLEPVVE